MQMYMEMNLSQQQHQLYIYVCIKSLQYQHPNKIEADDKTGEQLRRLSENLQSTQYRKVKGHQLGRVKLTLQHDFNRFKRKPNDVVPFPDRPFIFGCERLRVEIFPFDIIIFTSLISHVASAFSNAKQSVGDV